LAQLRGTIVKRTVHHYVTRDCQQLPQSADNYELNAYKPLNKVSSLNVLRRQAPPCRERLDARWRVGERGSGTEEVIWSLP
jgi:hypothetical protein